MLRTDYSNDKEWEHVAAIIKRPVGDLSANVTLLSSPEYDGTTLDEIGSLNQAAGHSFIFVVDKVSLTHPEHPILAVDLTVIPSQTLRVIPSELWGVENNLSLANMDFADFCAAVGEDGIFKGF